MRASIHAYTYTTGGQGVLEAQTISKSDSADSLHEHMRASLHSYMRTTLHACAYLFARLHTNVFLHAYVLT